MIPGICHKAAGPADQVCINHVMIADQKMGNTIQRDGTVDRFGGGTAPALPISALLQNNIVAIERSRRRPEIYHTPVEDVEASIPSTTPKNCLTVAADDQDRDGMLETRG